MHFLRLFQLVSFEPGDVLRLFVRFENGRVVAIQTGSGKAVSSLAKTRSLGASTHDRVVFILALATVIFLVLFPIGMLFYGSFRTANPGQPGVFTLSNYFALLGDSRLHAAVQHSLLVSLGSVLLATILGSSLAWITGRTNTPVREKLDFFVILPFFLSPFVNAIAWSFLLAPTTGLFNSWLKSALGWTEIGFDIYSIPGMIWVLGLSYTPYSYLFVSAALQRLDPSFEETARVSGATVFQTARRVTIPLVMPAVFASSILIFVLALANFGVPAILGIPRRIETIPTLIFAMAAIYPPNYTQGAALSVCLILTVSVLIWAERRWLARSRFVTVTGKGYRAGIMDIGKLRFVAFTVAVLYLLIAVVFPYAALVLVSLLRYYTTHIKISLFTVEHYHFALFGLTVTKRALRNSILFGTLVASILMTLSLLVSYVAVRARVRGKEIISYISSIPVAVPGIVMAMALLWAWISVPVGIYGTALILIVAFVTRYLPYGTRIVDASLRQIHTELEEAGKLCGASTLRIIKSIVAPLLRPAFLAGWILIFVIVIRELSVAILLYTSGNEVISTVLYEMWRDGSYGAGAALGIIQTAIISVAIFLLRRVSGGERIALGR